MSDGLYHPTFFHGTSAWIIQGENPKQIVSGYNLVPGQKQVQCSHRSKLCGLIGVAKHINDIYSTHNITAGHVELACDR